MSFRQAQEPECFAPCFFVPSHAALRCHRTHRNPADPSQTHKSTCPTSPRRSQHDRTRSCHLEGETRRCRLGSPGCISIGPYVLSYFSLFVCSGRCARMQLSLAECLFLLSRDFPSRPVRWSNNHRNALGTDTFVSFCVINLDVLRATCCVRTLVRQSGAVRASEGQGSSVEGRPRGGSDRCRSRHAVGSSPELTLLFLGRVHLFRVGQPDPDQSRRSSQAHANSSLIVSACGCESVTSG
jgi:hypothetical protein